MGIIRAAWNLLTGQSYSNVFCASDDPVETARNYFNRQTTKTQLKDSITEMYGVGIRQEKDPGNKNAVLETYVKQGFQVQVDNGMVETLSVGFGNKIVNAHSTLFTEKNGKFDLHGETDEADTTQAQELLEENRQKGNFKTTLVDADKISIQVGSGLVYPNYEGDTVVYRALDPNAVKAFYDDYVTEENTENPEASKTRPTDRTDLEDATYIIIRLGMVSVDKWKYLAIFGRSPTYPNGRHVQYVTGNTIEVPPDFDKTAIEYLGPDGEQANPMSLYANEHKDEMVPEYPIAVIYSCLADDGTAIPTYSTLHDDCLEFSRAASHVLGTSQVAATGTRVLMDDGSKMSAGRQLPRTSTGLVHLPPGMKMESVSHNPGAIEVAYKTLKGLMIDTASGYHVPDYMVVSEDYTVDAASGIALEVKSKPLKKFREYRYEKNRKSIQRLFAIEKVQIAQFAPEDVDESAIRQLESCTQTWDAGDLRLPENKQEEAARIKMLGEIGVLDQIGQIREYFKLATDAEAILLYEKMQQRAAEYPPLNQPKQPEKRPISLLRNQGNGR